MMSTDMHEVDGRPRGFGFPTVFGRCLICRCNSVQYLPRKTDSPLQTKGIRSTIDPDSTSGGESQTLRFFCKPPQVHPVFGGQNEYQNEYQIASNRCVPIDADTCGFRGQAQKKTPKTGRKTSNSDPRLQVAYIEQLAVSKHPCTPVYLQSWRGLSTDPRLILWACPKRSISLHPLH